VAVTLDPTPGVASANSYGSLAEAKSYFDSRLGGDAWNDVPDDDTRKKALIVAARDIDSEIYRGQRASSDQALQWPRVGTWLAGIPIASTVIPSFLKAAQFEQALWRLEQSGGDGSKNPLAPSGTEELKSLSAGPVRLDFRDRDRTADNGRAADDPSRNLAPAAYRLLRAYILTESISGGGDGVRNFAIYR
jgi:hypothetical protein